jgi:hypothetical protein
MSWFRLYSHKKTHDSTIFKLIYIYYSTFLCEYCNGHNNTELSLIIEKKTIKKMRNTDPPKTGINEQIILYKILCRKLKIEQHEPTKNPG